MVPYLCALSCRRIDIRTPGPRFRDRLSTSRNPALAAQLPQRHSHNACQETGAPLAPLCGSVSSNPDRSLKIKMSRSILLALSTLLLLATSACSLKSSAAAGPSAPLEVRFVSVSPRDVPIYQ